MFLEGRILLSEPVDAVAVPTQFVTDGAVLITTPTETNPVVRRIPVDALGHQAGTLFVPAGDLPADAVLITTDLELLQAGQRVRLLQLDDTVSD
jgi:hypothetical protein